MSSQLAEAIKEAIVARAVHLSTTGDIRNLLDLQANLKQAERDVAAVLRKVAAVLDPQEIRAENPEGKRDSDTG